MPANVFIDSNLWIYSFIEAKEEQEKRQTVLALLEKLSQQSHIVISIQVVNETHWTLQRRYKVEEELIQTYIMGMIAVAEVLPLTLVNYQTAQALRVHYSLSFWDSLIVSVVLQANCELLYSEDIHHTLVVQKKLRIQNPFQTV